MRDRAVEILEALPDMGGMRLLRAAMMALPPARRRKLVAVTQAPWFERAVAVEIERRSKLQRSRADVAPTIRAISADTADVSANTRLASSSMGALRRR
jgi:hypothetical protein